MNVVFISPHYPAEMQDFTRGLAEVSARVIGLGDVPREHIPAPVRHHLADYLHVPSLSDTGAVIDTLRRWRARHPGQSIDRIECLWEPFVLLAADLREALGVPGMTRDIVLGFRDKALMKQRLRAHGLRVPHDAIVDDADQARIAAARIGFPVVVKPIAGAGTAHTHRADDPGSLEQVLERILSARGTLRQLSVEEYIDGDEFTYDAVAINGAAVFESVTRYLPKPLEARNQEWISPAQITFRDPHIPQLRPGIELGRAVLGALGMGTGFVHMEWFRKSSGEVVFGEIGCRAGGAKLMDQINFANDFDVYREWARSVCWQHFRDQPHRRYHTAVVFKRATGQGRIRHVEGLDALRRHCGGWLVLEHLLPIGHPRRDWKQTLLSDGYVLIRHPDLGHLRAMIATAITELRLYAE